MGRDVRGYYVYRADGYDAELQQLPRMLLSTVDELTYNDTLPQSVNPSIYSYAVASVNTSYNISPISSRVNTSYSGGMLLAPSNLDGNYINGSIFTTWSDAASYNNAISGYQVFRIVIYETKVETQELLVSN